MRSTFNLMGGVHKIRTKLDPGHKYRKHHHQKTINTIEILLLAVSFVFSFGIHFNILSSSIGNLQALSVLLLMIPIWALMMQVTNLHTIPRINSYFAIFIGFLRFAFISNLFLILFTLLFSQFSISLSELTYYTIVSTAVVYLFRILTFKFLKTYRANGYNTHNIIIVADESSADIIQSIIDHKEWGYKIIMIASSSNLIKQRFGDQIKVISDKLNISSVIEFDIIDEVFYCKNVANSTILKNLIESCDELGVSFRILSHLSPMTTLKAYKSYINGKEFLTFSNNPRHSIGMIWKTLMDAIISFSILLVFSPLLAMVAILIKLDSKGPVFFKQQRIGLRGRKFYIYKFRTMVVNAEEIKAKLMAQNESDGPVFKIKKDPRITSIGRILRKTSLDELPQLLNVLKGEMSLIGPRPPLESEVRQYERWQLRRLSVKPGITCTWQIQPKRNDILFEKWMRLDMQYIDNWSLKQDFELLFKTAKSVINNEGY